MQPEVRMVSTNHQDCTITVLVNSRRFEFFVKPDCYSLTHSRVKRYIENQWFNASVCELLLKSNFVVVEDQVLNTSQISTKPPWRVNQMTSKIAKPANSTPQPDKEHQFTLIAPEANNGLVYQGQRVWHATAEDAVEYAKLIYNANKDQTFALVVVQAVQQVAPKPQIELTSIDFK